MGLSAVKTIQAESVDLGVVEAHHKVECGFAITNDSTTAWFVQGGRSSCACMFVEVRHGELRSGEVLPVRVVFDPQGMEGVVEKSVWVEFKSRVPVARNFRADVQQRLCFKPSDAAFGVIRSADAGRTIEATLAGYAATNAVITAIIPPTNAFFEVVGSAPRADRLTVRFAHANPLPGTYVETWRIRTTDSEIPEIAFPVSARIADGFTVTPHVLTIDARMMGGVRGYPPSEASRDSGGYSGAPALPGDECGVRGAPALPGDEHALVGSAPRADRTDAPRTVSRAVTLRRDDGKPFKVLSAETKPRKWGDVKIVERPLGGWQVVVENIDPDAVRQFSKKLYLEISTSLSGVDSLTIPLRVECVGNKGDM